MVSVALAQDKATRAELVRKVSGRVRMLPRNTYMSADRPPSMSFEPCREEDLDEEYRIRLTDPTADGGREPSSDEEEDSGSEASADAGAQPLAIAAPPDDGA